MTDWNSVLHAIAPNGDPSIIAGTAAAMPRMIARASLTSRLRLAHFLGQCAQESMGFQTTRELGGAGYLKGKSYYPYYGRGIIQTTWKANYAAVSRALAVDFVSHPDLLCSFPYAADSAAFYWATHPACNQGADHDDCRAVTHAVNGGFNGLNARLSFTTRAKTALIKAGV